MEIIVRPRQAGKSTEVLRRAAAHFAYIVTATHQEAEELWRRSRQLQLNIPKPITWREFVGSGVHGRGAKAFIIDNLDRCVQSMNPAPVVAVTMTDGRDDTYNSPAVAVEAGRFDGYGRRHFRVNVDGQAFTGYLEPAADPADLERPGSMPPSSNPLFLGKLNPGDFNKTLEGMEDNR